MKYKKELNNFEKACGLEKSQVERIKNVIQQAYDAHWNGEGNVDLINAFVAPHLHTPEEAFWAAQVILTDVFGQAA